MTKYKPQVISFHLRLILGSDSGGIQNKFKLKSILGGYGIGNQKVRPTDLMQNLNLSYGHECPLGHLEPYIPGKLKNQKTLISLVIK